MDSSPKGWFRNLSKVSSVNSSPKELAPCAAFVSTASMLSRKCPTSKFQTAIEVAPKATINQPTTIGPSDTEFFCRQPSPSSPPRMRAFTPAIPSMVKSAPSSPNR